MTDAAEMPKEMAEKNGVGRPTKFREEFIKWAEKFAKLGATNADLAKSFEVDTAQITRWMQSIPAFRTAIASGREYADANMADSLYRRGMGATVKQRKPVTLRDANGKTYVEIAEYEESYPPDTMAASLWLRNRRPDLWRDRVEHDVTLTARVGRLDDEERAGKALELVSRLIDVTPSATPSDDATQPADGATDDGSTDTTI